MSFVYSNYFHSLWFILQILFSGFSRCGPSLIQRLSNGERHPVVKFECVYWHVNNVFHMFKFSRWWFFVFQNFISGFSPLGPLLVLHLSIAEPDTLLFGGVFWYVDNVFFPFKSFRLIRVCLSEFSCEFCYLQTPWIACTFATGSRIVLCYSWVLNDIHATPAMWLNRSIDIC